MAACRKEQTLWPNWYKSLTIANVEYDNFGDKLDFIPKYQDLIFNSTAFRNRLRDNYERCKVCIDTTLDRRLTPTQLRRLMHHSERKKDILSGQKLLEYARDVDAPYEDDDSPNDSDRMIAVRTDSRYRGGLAGLRERLHRASAEMSEKRNQAA